MTTMRVVGECFFWYRLTRVFPDKFHRAVKRLCVVCVCEFGTFDADCIVMMAQYGTAGNRGYNAILNKMSHYNMIRYRNALPKTRASPVKKTAIAGM